MEKASPEKLKICLVSERFPVIGRTASQGFLWPIARGLAMAGHSVKIICWDSPFAETEITKENVKAYFVKGPNPQRKKMFPIRAQKKFEELHNEDPFDLVHSLSAAAFRIGNDKRKYGVAVAYDVQATRMAQLYSLIGLTQDSAIDRVRTGLRIAFRFFKTYFGRDLRLLRSADGMFVNSRQQQLTLERYYLYPELKTYQVPYGMEIGDLGQREQSSELKAKLNIPANGKIAVTVSDMIETQDMISLLEAFREVAIKKPSSYLIILGKGPKFKEIEYHMLSLALGNHVRMPGAVPNHQIPEYIDLCQVFINIAGRSSGFEPSLLEAMTQEKVVIGSEVSPISTIIEDGVDGFLVRPADIGELSQLFLRIFDSEISVGEIGKNARQKILDLFDTQNMTQEVLKAYRRILRSTGARK